MKKFKIALCAMLLLFSGVVFAACGEGDNRVSFDADKFVVSNAECNYDGNSHIFSVAYENLDIDVKYSLDGKTFKTGEELGLEDAGTYSVYYKVTSDGYKDYVSNAVDFIINKLDVTVNINDYYYVMSSGANFDNNVYTATVIGAEILGEPVELIYNIQGSTSPADAVLGDTFTISLDQASMNPNLNYTVNNGTVYMTEAVEIRTASNELYGYNTNFATAVAEAPTGSVIKLNTDVTLDQMIEVNKTLTIDGRGKFTINASDVFADAQVVLLNSADSNLTLKDVSVDANSKSRVIRANAGNLVINGATITGGQASAAQGYIGGVYVTNSANFYMTAGDISGNNNATEYASDNYLQYASDLWLGTNAEGTLAAINGGKVGSLFVNANEYSDENPGAFVLNGGEIENVYVEYDAGFGATFTIVKGVVTNLYVSTTTTGEAVKVSDFAGEYKGGVVAIAETSTNQFLASYTGFVTAVAEAPAGSVIKLCADVTLDQMVEINNAITIDGQGKYTITANTGFTGAVVDKYTVSMFNLNNIASVLELKDVTLDCNKAARAVSAFKGIVNINGAIIKNGKNVDDRRSGGVYITHAASFVMTAGEITGSEAPITDYADNYADLWLGANAIGSLVSISGGKIGSVFVNANEYSANNPGAFLLNGGEIDTVYVEYDAGYGATFTILSGTVTNLYVSTTTSGEAVKVEANVGQYIGGIVD